MILQCMYDIYIYIHTYIHVHIDGAVQSIRNPRRADSRRHTCFPVGLDATVFQRFRPGKWVRPPKP